MNMASAALTTAFFMVGSIRCIVANFTLSNSTLPIPMYQHFAGVFDNKLTVFGGKEASSPFSPITTSYTALIQIGLDDIEWNANNFTLPLGTTRLDEYSSECTVSVNDDVYIVNPNSAGGTATPYYGLFAYSLSSHQFTVLPNPPHKAGWLCAVYSDASSVLYAIGGYMGGILRYTQRFNVTAKQWMGNGANTAVAVYHPGCSMDRTNEKIFLFGGDKGGTYTDGIQKYIVSNDSWRVIPETMSIARIDPKCRVVQGSIYCVGGQYYGGTAGSAAMLRTVDVFDSVSETITNTIQLNVARWEFTATVWNDAKCLIITGGTTGSDGFDSIETMGDCIAPTESPTNHPTLATDDPSVAPSSNPTSNTDPPTADPTLEPTEKPTSHPTKDPISVETTQLITTASDGVTASSPTHDPNISMIILCIISILIH